MIIECSGVLAVADSEPIGEFATCRKRIKCGLAILNHFQLEENRAVGQTLPASIKALEVRL